MGSYLDQDGKSVEIEIDLIIGGINADSLIFLFDDGEGAVEFYNYTNSGLSSASLKFIITISRIDSTTYYSTTTTIGNNTICNINFGFASTNVTYPSTFSISATATNTNDWQISGVRIKAYNAP